MKVVVGLFERPQDAERALEALENAGFVKDELSTLAQGRIVEEHLGEQAAGPVVEGASVGAVTGTTIGGLAGLLAGVGAITIPGIGPVLAAGALATTLAGAGVGAAAGGLVGALIGLGIVEDEADFYAEGVKRGGVLVAVQSSGQRASLAKDILKQANAVDVETRRKTWLNDGWVGFDESNEPGLGYPKVWNRPGS